MRLNPYYTGIHLHIKEELVSSYSKCLNPYYTGIHLHKTTPENTAISTLS